MVTDPKMEGYVPLQTVRDEDQDYSSRRIRDMPHGKRRSDIQFSVTSLTFEDTEKDDVSASQTVVITNTGYDRVDIIRTTLTTDYVLRSPVPEYVLPGETVTVSVAFRPVGLGIRRGSLYIDTGDAAGDEQIALNGVGVENGEAPSGIWVDATELDLRIQAELDARHLGKKTVSITGPTGSPQDNEEWIVV